MDPEPCAPFEEIEHTADLALRVCAPDRQRLFEYAAQGLFALMHLEPQGDPEEIHHVLTLDAADEEVLLVDWLSELLYLSERHRAVYHTFRFSQLTSTHLAAEVHGRTRHVPLKHIKAVTFHDLSIRQDADGLRATITFDV